VSSKTKNNNIIHNLEDQLINSDNSSFPTILVSEQSNTKSYPDRYNILKTKLGAKHDSVELMTSLKSVEQEIQSDTAKNELYDKIILLNKHGKGHIENVISRASDLASCIIDEKAKLVPFEVFILLCAIQIHDIGNMYGRKEHTTSFKADFDKYSTEAFITESVLKACIFNIAKVHGGKINNNADTIETAGLHNETSILRIDVRQRLLAALLRFADELADDSTRALDIPKIPEYSKIFHAYSHSLHTVKIEKIKNGNAYHVKLCYFLNISEALTEYKKLEKDGNEEPKPTSISLIREIIKRTIKMEYERRYCARYFLPYFILKHIAVEIEIDFGSLNGKETIVYTLEETGYPGEDIKLPPNIEDSIANLERRYTADGGIK